MQVKCPKTRLESKRGELKWRCGSEHIVLYEESEIDCFNAAECPPGREKSTFFGARFGIFVPSKGTVERRIVAWPRFEDCEDWGCSGGDWDESSVSIPESKP